MERSVPVEQAAIVPAFECRELIVARGERAVLSGVRLTIGAGECVTFIGPNGAGKTSLLLTMLGLLAPAGGVVLWSGRPLAQVHARERGRLASYVPQGVDRLPSFSVYDVVAGGRYAHVPALHPLSRADHEIVRAAIEQCGLADLQHRNVNELSGGERQKTLIAAALAQDAQAMFLDEPNTALDAAVQREMAGVLKVWRDRGRTLVMVSHDLHLPAVLGGRVIALQGGRVAGDGPAERMLRPERLSEVFGSPFAMARTDSGREVVVPDW